MSPDRLKAILEEAIQESQVQVTDLTGTQDHYQVDVCSSAFEGKSLLQRHQMVYAPLREFMAGSQGEIHALSVNARTP